MKSLIEFIADIRPIPFYVIGWVRHFLVEVLSLVVMPFIKPQFGQPPISLRMSIKIIMRRVFVLVVRFPLQFMLTIVSLLLNALASLINNTVLTSNERSLSAQEIQYLKPIFGKTLNYHAIRIQSGGIKEKMRIAPQAVAGDIFLRAVWGSPIFNSDQSLTPSGLRLLGHEACHVWQYQHHGAGYIGDSLITQALDSVGRKVGVHMSDGYDLGNGMLNKKLSWRS